MTVEGSKTLRSAQDGDGQITWREVGFPATFADIATPFTVVRDNLRGEGAAAQRIAKRLGKAKFLVIKGLFGLLHLQLHLIERLLGRDFAGGLWLFEGLDGTRYPDCFGYRSQRGIQRFEHGILRESADPGTDQEG